MTDLLVILTPIGLLDSTTIVPLYIVVLVVALAGLRPLLTSSAFIFGVFAFYLVCGLLLLLGLQSVFDELNEYAVRVYNDPDTEELIVQIVLGVVLCLFGIRIIRKRKSGSEKPSDQGMTPFRAATVGAGLTIAGLPGAVPYFAAIDLTLRADLSTTGRILAIVYYNLIFVSPLAAIVAFRLALGDRANPMLDAVKLFFDRWGQRALVAILMVFGIVLIVDGVGWFLGFPIFPI